MNMLISIPTAKIPKNTPIRQPLYSPAQTNTQPPAIHSAKTQNPVPAKYSHAFTFDIRSIPRVPVSFSSEIMAEIHERGAIPTYMAENINTKKCFGISFISTAFSMITAISGSNTNWIKTALFFMISFICFKKIVLTLLILVFLPFSSSNLFPSIPEIPFPDSALLYAFRLSFPLIEAVSFFPPFPDRLKATFFLPTPA